jgi:hypothetical protein
MAKWYEMIGESTIADAILDRLIHTAHRIELKGESLRKKMIHNFTLQSSNIYWTTFRRGNQQGVNIVGIVNGVWKTLLIEML